MLPNVTFKPLVVPGAVVELVLVLLHLLAEAKEEKQGAPLGELQQKKSQRERVGTGREAQSQNQVTGPTNSVVIATIAQSTSTETELSNAPS